MLAWLYDRGGTGASVALPGPRRSGKTWVLAELERRLRSGGASSVQRLAMPQRPNSMRDTPDEIARLLDRSLEEVASPAAALLDSAAERAGTVTRRIFLLDEIGRLVRYGPICISWLRDLGQAGAWLVYAGTEKDWHEVTRLALTAPAQPSEATSTRGCSGHWTLARP